MTDTTTTVAKMPALEEHELFTIDELLAIIDVGRIPHND